MTTLPAVVTIVDLDPIPSTAVSNALVFECVATVGGVGNSYQVAFSQLATTAFGNLPTGGNTGQLLDKSSGADFATQWVNLSSLLTAGAALSASGSTAVVISLATTAGLSVLGVAGAATAAPAPIVGVANQVLVINPAGTTAQFGKVNLAASAAVTGQLTVPFGGSGTSALTAFGVVFGNGSSAFGATAAGTTGWPLLGNGTALGPSFQQIGLASAGITGVLGVPHGGTNTTTFTAFGVVFANSTTSLGATAAGTSGLPLVANGTALAPTYQPLAVANISAMAASTLVANNTNGVAAPTAVPYGNVLGHVLLNVLTAAAATFVSDSTSFRTTFNNYLLFCDNLVPTNNTTQFQFQVRSGGVVQTASYLNQAGGATTYIDFTGAVLIGSTAGAGFSGPTWLSNVNNTAVFKLTRGQMIGVTNTAGVVGVTPSGYWNGSTAAISGFQLGVNTGTFSGTVTVYGMRSA